MPSRMTAPKVPRMTGEQLRRYRVQRRLSKNALAKRMGVSQRYIAMIELDQRAPWWLPVYLHWLDCPNARSEV